MLQGVLSGRVSLPTNSRFLCASTCLRHGETLEFQRYRRWTMRWLWREVVFIPQGEPGRNATIESFNDLWQERVLRRHTCPSLARLRKVNERFLRYYQYKKPHRGLTQKDHGTRFPGILRESLWESLKQISEGFDPEHYVDARGCLNIPVAKGKVSFIRKVNILGKVEINGVQYFIRKKLEGQYIVATIFTRRKKLVIKHDGKTIKTFSFHVKGHIIDPFLKDKKKRQNL